MVHGSSPTHKTRARAFRGLETAAVRRPPRSRVWMHPLGNHFMRFLPLGAFVAAVGLAGFLWPASADAYQRHPLIVAVTGGACRVCSGLRIDRLRNFMEHLAIARGRLL